MVSYQKGKYNWSDLCLISAIVLFFLIGLSVNIFILVVNVRDWLKKRPMTLPDQLITIIATARGILAAFCLVDMLVVTFPQDDQDMVIRDIILYLIAETSTQSNIWFSAFLGIIVCLKICSSQKLYYLKVKNIVFKKANHLIIAILLLSFCYSVVTLLVLATKSNNNGNWTNVYDYNTFENLDLYIDSYLLIALGRILPFLLYGVGTVLFIESVCHHMANMKSNAEAPVRLAGFHYAIKNMTICFFLNGAHVISSLAVIKYYYALNTMLAYVLWNFFQVLHTFFIIFTAAKLKEKVLKILKRRPWSRDPPETNYTVSCT